MAISTPSLQCLVGTGALLLAAAGGLPAEELTNLAAARAGGHLVFFSSQYDEDNWRAEHLIDGTTASGWAGQSSGPQSVVLGFRDGGLAEVHDVLIDPYTREDPSNWAREVELAVSEELPFRGFRPAGRFTLANQGGLQVFSLPAPTHARYLKVRFLSNYGGGYMEAGEIEVMGRLLAGAAAAPEYRNVAAAAAGARIERFSSQYDEAGWAAANLLAEDGGDGWAGSSGASQEVVIALAEAVEITDVAVDNYAREDPSNWAKEVAVEVSATSSYKDLQPVGRLSMPPVGDLHTLTLENPLAARYVKLRFLSNHGGGYMEAARVRVFAAPSSGPSELARQLEATGRAVAREIHFASNSADILPESESVLRQIAALLGSDPGLELIIEGHTDDLGGAEFNLDLSRRRADAVKRWLVDRAGIGEVRLTTVGYGLTRPVASNDSDEGRALNRRVELVKRE